MAKSFREKHDGHKYPPKVETLDKPWAGLQKGQTIGIATPKHMSAYFQKIPRGETRTIEDLRASIAKQLKADAACPMTTGIFCRIAAEAALEEIAEGAKPAEVAPFWRLIDPKSPLAKKLSCGPDFIREMRQLEGVSSTENDAKKKKPTQAAAKNAKKTSSSKT